MTFQQSLLTHLVSCMSQLISYIELIGVCFILFYDRPLTLPNHGPLITLLVLSKSLQQQGNIHI
jgi:hypothetical protein